jgi:hypothetical protein
MHIVYLDSRSNDRRKKTKCAKVMTVSSGRNAFVFFFYDFPFSSLQVSIHSFRMTPVSLGLQSFLPPLQRPPGGPSTDAAANEMDSSMTDSPPKVPGSVVGAWFPPRRRTEGRGAARVSPPFLLGTSVG